MIHPSLPDMLEARQGEVDEGEEAEASADEDGEEETNKAPIMLDSSADWIESIMKTLARQRYNYVLIKKLQDLISSLVYSTTLSVNS